MAVNVPILFPGRLYTDFPAADTDAVIEFSMGIVVGAFSVSFDKDPQGSGFTLEIDSGDGSGYQVGQVIDISKQSDSLLIDQSFSPQIIGGRKLKLRFTVLTGGAAVSIKMNISCHRAYDSPLVPVSHGWGKPPSIELDGPLPV